MIAVDTNVLIYAYDEGSPRKREIARETLRTMTGGVLLWQVACEFLAAFRKLKGASPLEAWDRLGEIRALHPLHLPTHGVLERAQEIQRHGNVQFWDSMIYSACIECGVTTLLSEDTPGLTIPGLTIQNPFLQVGRG